MLYLRMKEISFSKMFVQWSSQIDLQNLIQLWKAQGEAGFPEETWLENPKLSTIKLNNASLCWRQLRQQLDQQQQLFGRP